MVANKEKDAIRIFVKTYTIPMLVLIIGILLYYGVFRESTKKYIKNNIAQTHTAGDTKPHINPNLPKTTNQTIAPTNPLESKKDISKIYDDSNTKIPLSTTHNTQDSTQNNIQSTKSTPQIFYVTKNLVNIRQEANTTAPIIAKAPFASKISVKDIKDGWAEIESGGFVFVELLSKELPLESKTTIQTQPTSNNPSTLSNSNDVVLNNINTNNIDSTNSNDSNTPYTAQPNNTNTQQYATIIDTNVYEKPSISSLILQTIKQNNKINVVRVEKNFAELEQGGFVELESLIKLPSDF